MIDKNKGDHTSVSIEEVEGKGIGVSWVTIQNGGNTWPGSDPFYKGIYEGKTYEDKGNIPDQEMSNTTFINLFKKSLR